MGLLLETAENFKKMFNIKYDILLGKKNREVNIIITFRSVDFHHLAGLHYIKDLPELKQSREKIFEAICTDSNLRNKIYNSEFYTEIEDRIIALNQIEKLFDSDNLIFNYDYKNNKMSKIRADFLIQSVDNNQLITYIFGEKSSHDKNSTSKEVYCKSIFHKSDMDYTKFQSKYTVLKFKKICTINNSVLKTYVNPNYIEKQ
ncbi:MAG: PBECR4 domain-containing protein [Oscillospiraceae bacterium]